MGSRVARRLPGRHSSVAASPLRCRTGLALGESSGRPPPGVFRWSVARRHMLDTSLEQYVRKTSHDRTAAAHVTSHGARCCASFLDPFSSRSPTRLGRGTLAGSTPASYGASQVPDGAATAWVCMTTGAGRTAGPFLVSRHLLFRRGRPLLAVSGSSRGWPACLSSSRMWSAIAGDRGLFAPQSSCPGSSRRQGSHLPYTSMGLLLSSQPDATRRRVWKVLAEFAVSSWEWGADTHARKLVTLLDTLEHCGAPAACTVMRPSERAKGL